MSLFHSIPHPRSIHLIFSRTHVPTVPTVPERHLHRKSDQSTRRWAWPLLTVRRNTIPNSISLIQFGICADTYWGKLLVLILLCDERGKGGVRSSLSVSDWVRACARPSPLLLSINVEPDLQFGCAEHRKLDTGAIAYGVYVQAWCDLVWFRLLRSVDIYSVMFWFRSKHQRCVWYLILINWNSLVDTFESMISTCDCTQVHKWRLSCLGPPFIAHMKAKCTITKYWIVAYRCRTRLNHLSTDLIYS